VGPRKEKKTRKQRHGKKRDNKENSRWGRTYAQGELSVCERKVDFLKCNGKKLTDDTEKETEGSEEKPETANVKSRTKNNHLRRRGGGKIKAAQLDKGAAG